MFQIRLQELIRKKNSLLCIGLDCDREKIPPFLLKESNPLLRFNEEMIQATRDFAIAYKPNIAFYESLGVEGWNLFEKTLKLIPSDSLIIADAKRGDISNTAQKYANLYFGTFRCDAITLSPYMGQDSVQPFIQYGECGVFILCLTSNPGSRDFQYLAIDQEPLYMKVARKVSEWNIKHGNCGLVVGATHSRDIKKIRAIAPDMPFLIPGIGTQGGNLKQTIQFGTDNEGGNILVNVSRSILYASAGKDFADAARKKAGEMIDEMNKYR